MCISRVPVYRYENGCKVPPRFGFVSLIGASDTNPLAEPLRSLMAATKVAIQVGEDESATMKLLLFEAQCSNM